MASTQLALVRHGSYLQPPGVPSALLPYPLTDAGREEARAAAQGLVGYLREARLVLHPVIDSSSLLRAYETACLYADVIRRERVAECVVEQFDALVERSLGGLANLTEMQIAEVMANDPRVSPLPANWKRNTDFRLPFPGAESLREAGQRVARHIVERTELLVSEPASLKVFIGHGGAFRHAALALGVLNDGDVSRLSMYHALPVYLERSARGFRHVAGRWKARESSEP
jgi:broad specificity phosphatase PhoE